jgi:hypothetical protein
VSLHILHIYATDTCVCVCVCVLNAFCDHCSKVKWQTLRIRQFASSFVLTLRRQLLRHMQEHKPLNSIQVSEVTRIWLGFWMFTLPKVMSDWIKYGILHILQNEAVPQTQTVNQQFYTGVLKRLGEDFGRKCPNKWGIQTGFCIMTISCSKAVGLHSMYQWLRCTYVCLPNIIKPMYSAVSFVQGSIVFQLMDSSQSPLYRVC